MFIYVCIFELYMPVSVCLLISVRISCRYNSTDIYLQMSKTDGKSIVAIPQQNSGEKEFINPQSRKENRTAEISRCRVDKGTFTDIIISQCKNMTCDLF